ncbi:polyhydroxybutyrate depolymerase [Bradyrhizobium sediminis]|uniref:Polyhydroxybutyrate depolymerase n=1 Tax=Bradyrhizobium sediminis TaxID=2840469 RepID=A0A975NF64_9BRAD|nr:PHB depolymerase family esterase [Bradyrhizobium sediminis]QWG13715.1 polyhydroxybutyrate depolymerase [Bradyrhizobium sediminis]
MVVAALRRTSVAIGCAAFIAGPALAQAPAALPGYNAAIGESSISGISSGAFMAVQFATAWSSVIKGVGVVAGGPYWCAKAGGFFSYWSSITNATGPCLSGPPPGMSSFFAKADAKSASGAIDSLQFVRRQKIYLFHGYNDKVVARSVADAAADFYRHYLGEANRGNLYYQTTIGAGHSLVVAQDPPRADLNECKASISPFIDQCGYDQAGIILQHIYGALSSPNAGPLSGTIRPFDQSLYTKPGSAGSLSLGKTGYVFVPRECENGEACRVHIALHGCNQQEGPEIGRRFVERTGYNAWADTNRLIVLYPQTTAKWYPYNPHACWDWWGYVNYDDSYVTKSGAQVRTIKAMLDALTARAAPAAVSSPAPAATSIMLRVIDRSDTGADLAWAPQAGATAYRVFRAGADGPFAAVAEVAGPSFADSGLTPKTAYRWRVAAIVNGVEGPASGEAAATTRPVPAPCANPGACPIGE